MLFPLPFFFHVELEVRLINSHYWLLFFLMLPECSRALKVWTDCPQAHWLTVLLQLRASSESPRSRQINQSWRLLFFCLALPLTTLLNVLSLFLLGQALHGSLLHHKSNNWAWVQETSATWGICNHNTYNLKNKLCKYNTFFSPHQQSVLQGTTFRPGCPSHFQVSNRRRKCQPF